jgi:capsular polysaccharide biosynthesis protein
LGSAVPPGSAAGAVDHEHRSRSGDAAIDSLPRGILRCRPSPAAIARHHRDRVARYTPAVRVGGSRVTLRNQLEIVRTWAWLVVLSVVVGGLVGFIVASQIPPTYTSRVSILVGPPLGGVINNDDIQVGQSLRQTYADLATTRPLLQKVITSTGLDITPEQLAEGVATRVPSSSSLLFVEVTNQDRARAATLANGIATELVRYPTVSTDVKPSPNVILTVVDPAVPPTSANARGPLFSAALGAAIGFVFAIFVAFMVENLRRQSPESSAETVSG